MSVAASKKAVMSLACTTPKYEQLYARWLRNPEELLVLAELRPGQIVVDLCGGSGAVAKAALNMHAIEVVLLDLNPRIDPTPGCVTVSGRAEEADVVLGPYLRALGEAERGWGHPAMPDLVVCRQALGYLELLPTARAVSRILHPGGRFVFNNFKRPKWGIRRYTYAGKRFFEASAFIGKHVFHVQHGRGIGSDLTSFRWHTSEEVVRAMRQYFGVVEEYERDKSYSYICRDPFV